MDGNELSELISLRRTVLRELLAMSHRQVEAVGAARMSELMSILSEKQRPLQTLSEIAARLRGAADDDPQARIWDSPESRENCRQQQEECEQMHLELLAIEAQCETTLQKSRANIQQELHRMDTAQQAATSYAHTQAISTTGGKLDLSSD